MDLFKGKTPAERNKLIAAIVLGVLAFSALAFAFAPGFFRGSSTSAKVTVDSAAKPSSNNAQPAPGQFRMPTQDEQLFDYGTTPIAYRPGVYGAPAPGRNIFAFYEPPPPTPWSPTPVIIRTPVPTPTPTPFPYFIAAVMPQTVYAGQRSFKLEIAGEGFEPTTKIYFNQALLPTTYLGPQRLTAEVPANMIATAGGKQIIVSSLDGQKYSEQRMLNVQAPPTPNYEYVGMISRKHGNNDTAYFVEKGKTNSPGVVPQGKRLNDILGGRFRLISISDKETLFEDVNLGFKHPLKLLRTAPGGSTGAPSGFPSGFPNSGRPQQSFPGFPNVTVPQPRPVRPPGNTNRPRRDDDDDDDDDDGTR